MKKIVIRQISLLNFKGIRNLTVNFDEYETFIYGNNGTGKTTLFDSFTWLLFGKDSKDRKDFNIKCHDIDVNVSTLSGGNQQKVLLAKWVISQPDILILDEPTRGIDVGAKYEIYEIIDKLADAGKAVIVISSELPELIGICDRIYTVSYGVVTDNVEKNGFTQEYLMKGMTKEREVAA